MYSNTRGHTTIRLTRARANTACYHSPIHSILSPMLLILNLKFTNRLCVLLPVRLDFMLINLNKINCETKYICIFKNKQLVKMRVVSVKPSIQKSLLTFLSKKNNNNKKRQQQKIHK